MLIQWLKGQHLKCRNCGSVWTGWLGKNDRCSNCNSREIELIIN